MATRTKNKLALINTHEYTQNTDEINLTGFCSLDERTARVMSANNCDTQFST